MDILNDVVTSDQLKQDTDQILEDMLVTSHAKLIIFEGKPSFVLISSAQYQAQLERLAILERIERGRKELDEGKVVSNEVVIADLQRMMTEISAKRK